METALNYLEKPAHESAANITWDKLPTVMAEHYPLTLLFKNLISNSIKYRKSGKAPVVHVNASGDGEGWTFCVSDNGIGIEPGNIENVFAPFKRLHGREYPGTGLGLAMCRRIVDRYHGRIWAEPGTNGTTIRFTVGSDGKRPVD
jgi:light-regulated signal transduction histidine kinase (bacteriophytochrome)